MIGRLSVKRLALIVAMVFAFEAGIAIFDALDVAQRGAIRYIEGNVDARRSFGDITDVSLRKRYFVDVPGGDAYREYVYTINGTLRDGWITIKVVEKSGELEYFVTAID